MSSRHLHVEEAFTCRAGIYMSRRHLHVETSKVTTVVCCYVYLTAIAMVTGCSSLIIETHGGSRSSLLAQQGQR